VIEVVAADLAVGGVVPDVLDRRRAQVAEDLGDLAVAAGRLLRRLALEGLMRVASER